MMDSRDFESLENDNTSITLYSGVLCHDSHYIRLIMAMKDVRYNLVNLKNPKKPTPELLAVSDYPAPVLTDRNLTLYSIKVIAEYIDERFPYPPLMPIDPISKARLRLALYHLEEEWKPMLKKAASSRGNVAAQARKILKEYASEAAVCLQNSKYFLRSEPSLVDCALAPILWRLPDVGVTLKSKAAKAVVDYEKRFFKLPAFRNSLSNEEAYLRER